MYKDGVAAACHKVAHALSIVPSPNAGVDITLACNAGVVSSTYNLGKSGSWSIFSQPAGGTASVDGSGVVTGMNLTGTYTVRLSVAGTSTICHDDVDVVYPPCIPCRPSICLPIKVIRITHHN